jgi:RNA polymerase sigma-70 factor (ECF subfamily)
LRRNLGVSTPADTRFERIYEQHYPKLYTLAFRLTGKKEDAEDVLQTSFLNAYRTFDEFRGDSSVYTWLYRIVLNAAKDYTRKVQKIPVVEYSESHDISQDEVYAYINKFPKVEDEVLAQLTKENCLPSKYRAVFTLRCILKCTVEETADILGISREAVKTNLHRARQTMKEQIEGRCSLINPDAPCNCCSFAGYLQQTGQAATMQEIATIKARKEAAADEYSWELRTILNIEELYNTQVLPPSFPDFISRIKELAGEGELKLLRY